MASFAIQHEHAVRHPVEQRLARPRQQVEQPSRSTTHTRRLPLIQRESVNQFNPAGRCEISTASRQDNRNYQDDWKYFFLR
jgi:hypothetical protein